jgi:hypothetical protein
MLSANKLRAVCLLPFLALATPPLLGFRSVAAQQNPATPFAFSEHDRLLRTYTDAQGRVDYDGLRANPKDVAALDRLVQSLVTTGPDKTPALYPNKQHALAYYLSAYNLLVWKNVLDQHTKRVDESGFAFFKKPPYPVDGKQLTLDDLEKKLIRPRFLDPRVHFALNCASGGCPRLPREAFVPERVHDQLDREARTFIGEKRNVDYDAARKRVKLSMIFKWYKDDFAKDDAGLIAYLNKYRPAAQPLPPDVIIEHVEYDWRLNDPTLPPR